MAYETGLNGYDDHPRVMVPPGEGTGRKRELLHTNLGRVFGLEFDAVVVVMNVFKQIGRQDKPFGSYSSSGRGEGGGCDSSSRNDPETSHRAFKVCRVHHVEFLPSWRDSGHELCPNVPEGQHPV
jgi:hypothetical protein